MINDWAAFTPQGLFTQIWFSVQLRQTNQLL